ncbi:hypothetical protein [Paenibacillus sanguinis]|uniref:hypothetical protein n=1 Tax=Paenibacillus sanguinis TaxID=225906 RepID=UPI00037DB5D1|nr:hypothetical protein [Paenibacillus sanguinis]
MLNPTNPVLRLRTLLSFAKSPILIRPAAIVAGLTEQEVCQIVAGDPQLAIVEGRIAYRDPADVMIERVEQELARVLPVTSADRLYRDQGCTFEVSAGQLIHTYIEQEQEEIA